MTGFDAHTGTPSPTVMASPFSPSHLLLGTYTRTTSKGVYRAPFDDRTGEVGPPECIIEAKNPTWLAWSPDHANVYVTDAGLEGIKACGRDPATGAWTVLNQQASGAGHPTHVVIDATGRMAISANYGTGTVTSWPRLPDGTLGPARTLIRHQGSSINPDRQKEPHAHGVTLSPDNRFVFVPDLGTDKVMAYVLDHARAELTPHVHAFTPVPPGSGPRHLSFSPDGRHAYVINEMGGTIASFAYDAHEGRLTLLGVVPTLPSDFNGANKTAEVIVHPRGHVVYGSNRGHDSLVVFARDPATGLLTWRQTVPSGGRSPRHFDLSPDGRWLVALHEESNDGYVFRVDPATGQLERTNHHFQVPQPVCVLFGQ